MSTQSQPAYRYRTTLRPASTVSIPRGVTWEYAEMPREFSDAAKRMGKPVSDHRYGVMLLSRRLTREECEHFDIVDMN